MQCVGTNVWLLISCYFRDDEKREDPYLLGPVYMEVGDPR